MVIGARPLFGRGSDLTICSYGFEVLLDESKNCAKIALSVLECAVISPTAQHIEGLHLKSRPHFRS